MFPKQILPGFASFASLKKANWNKAKIVFKTGLAY
jgi:hypothetical protein